MAIKDWGDIPKEHLENMAFLGEFSPATNVHDKLVKGWMHDFDEGGTYESYLGPNELRDIATSCAWVADWLEARSAEATPQEPPQ